MAILDGKNVLITGAASGIGLATAELFLKEGAKLHLLDISQSALETAAQKLGNGVTYTKADVTDHASVGTALTEAMERFQHLDVVISNAGISGPVDSIENVSLTEFHQVLNVHVMGAVTTLQATLPHVSKGGSVIITSSVTGLIGIPNMAAYATAKHAQVGLMRSVAREVADRKIRVNTIHPGPVDNEFQSDIERRSTGLAADEAQAAFDEDIPLGRHSEVHEIAQGMLYLASDSSSMVTSTTFRIDGGIAN